MPDKHPAPLPLYLICELAEKSGLLLCLDYDGTLSEITTNPAAAWPYPGVSESIQILTRSKKVALAIISGRPISEVKGLLGIDSGLLFSGIHGQELELPGGTLEVLDAPTAEPELDLARQWLARNVPHNRGFRIEDKGTALGLHYRMADPAQARILHHRFAEFIDASAPHLRLLPLKKLIEVIPRTTSKGRAVAGIKALYPSSLTTVYFGDDVTDEDAFEALAAPDFGVLVGADRPSAARYRLESPSDMAHILNLLATGAPKSCSTVSR
jgi:trehalose-phosphatase